MLDTKAERTPSDGVDMHSTGKDAHIDNPFSSQRVLSRFVEWIREMPGIIRGLYALAHPLRRQLCVIFLFNVAIAIWETAQPLIVKMSIDELSPASTYLKAFLVITIPMIVLAVPHGIVLPFFRDLYMAWHFRPLFEKHVGMLCLDTTPENGIYPEELNGKRAPIAQEGRTAALGLTEILLRDPAFAIRGIAVLGGLLLASPILALIVMLGMLADLFVTVLMDERLFRPYALQREFQFRVRSIEYKAFDEAADPAEKQRLRKACEAEWDNYIEATRNAEKWRLIYQMPVRETISLISRATGMLLVAWWVLHGTASIGDYYFITQLASRANDPLFVILGIQQNVMTTRESLRRLGMLCNIDFSIVRPKFLKQ